MQEKYRKYLSRITVTDENGAMVLTLPEEGSVGQTMLEVDPNQELEGPAAMLANVHLQRLIKEYGDTEEVDNILPKLTAKINLILLGSE